MAVDFTVDPEVAERRHRVRHFIRDVVIPVEADLVMSRTGPDDTLRKDLQQEASSQR